ncbi:M56 family metallopeptidase [Bizionia sp. KMM 8389]
MDYLLKASVLITIFYIGYICLLQRETFFNNNRLFLSFGIICTLILPSIIIPVYIEVAPQINTSNTLSATHIPLPHSDQTYSIMDILWTIYVLGVILFSVRFIINIHTLVQLIHSGTTEKDNNLVIVKTDRQIAPFSFFKWIVYNPNQYQTKDLNSILNHEQVHAKHWHSIDVILSQIACIIFWFNPIIWLYKKILEQNLEFIADKYAQSKTSCKKSYQRLLLKTSVPTHQLVIANNFYNSLIKKRIVMLNKSKSNPMNNWKYVLIIPALALFLMSFNTKEVYIYPEATKASLSSEIFTVTAETSNTELQAIETYFSSKIAKVKFAAIKRNQDNTIREITIKTNYDGGSKYVKRMTVGLDELDNIEPFTISLSDNKTELIFQFSENETSIVSAESIRFSNNTINSNTKKAPSEDNKLGENPLYIINNTPYPKSFLNNKTFKVEKKIITLNKTEGLQRYGEAGKDGVIIFEGETTFNIKNEHNVLTLVITKDFTDLDLNATREKLKQENVKLNFKGIKRNSYNEITNIELQYSTKGSTGSHVVNGKNPINSIKLTLNKEDNTIKISNLVPFNNKDNFLILLNNNEITVDEMNMINPNIIIKTDIITDSEKLKKYGEKGKNGVIEITTKK